MCGIQVQKDESTIQYESDCMYTCERCGEGGADDTGGVANYSLYLENYQRLDANNYS